MLANKQPGVRHPCPRSLRGCPSTQLSLLTNRWLIRTNHTVCGLAAHAGVCCSMHTDKQQACQTPSPCAARVNASAARRHARPHSCSLHAATHSHCPWHSGHLAARCNNPQAPLQHTSQPTRTVPCRRHRPLQRHTCKAASAAGSSWDSGGLPGEDSGNTPSSSTQGMDPHGPSPARRLANAGREWLMSVLAPLIAWVTLYRDIIQRVLVTIAMLTVFRCGLFIPLPGMDFGLLPAQPAFSEGERLVRALYGQARALPASLFELGISPYINASILITLVLAMPEQMITWGPLNRLREARKEGRAGQAYITSILNWLALGFSVYLALVKAVELRPYAVSPGPGYLPLTAMVLVAGSAIIQHCASIITASGIGNGSSLVICCGIITEYAEALHAVMSRLEAGAIAPSVLAGLGATYGALALAAVYISRTELRLPVLQYSRGNTGPPTEGANNNDGTAMFSSARRQAEMRMARRVARAEYFPIPLNGSGMMSIILAGAFWYFMMPTGAMFLGLTGVHATLLSLQASWVGLLIYALLVFAVEFLPLGGINPKDVAEYFNAMNVGIKGVVPGEPTEQHVQQQLLLCKFWGGLALGCLAVAAHVFDAVCLGNLGASLSATSLLIIVGTVIQSSRQVESLLEAPQLNSQLHKEQGLIKSLANL